MIDEFRDTKRPLLSVLTDKDSIFVRGLAKFKHRSLYSNIVNDRSAVHYTTAISRIDPFVKLDEIKINYLKGYEPVVIDPNDPISPKDDEPLPDFYRRLAGGGREVASRLPRLLFLLLFIPLGTVLFLMNSVVQTFRSNHRIRLHLQGKAAVPVGIYRFPLLVREAQREARLTAEDVFENINSSQSQEYLPPDREDMAAPTSPLLSPKRMRSSSSSTATEKALDSTAGDAVAPGHAEARPPIEFPTLALTPAQFAMIENLDAVGWRKYPVYIHQTTLSHAAMIVRTPRASFGEGKLVVGHWLSEFVV